MKADVLSPGENPKRRCVEIKKIWASNGTLGNPAVYLVDSRWRKIQTYKEALILRDEPVKNSIREATAFPDVLEMITAVWELWPWKLRHNFLVRNDGPQIVGLGQNRRAEKCESRKRENWAETGIMGRKGHSLCSRVVCTSIYGEKHCSLGHMEYCYESSEGKRNKNAAIWC